MKSKLLALILTMCMMATLIPFGSGATEYINPYSDVSNNAWYYDTVKESFESGLFLGVSDTLFAPDDSVTRAMFVTVLGRICNIDLEKYSGRSAFSDVSESDYYSPYLAWAKETGLTTGTGNGCFSPAGNITRQEIAVFVSRFLDILSITPSSDKTLAMPTDLELTALWARESVIKLWQASIFVGSDGMFEPNKTATRAEAAALLVRVNRLISKNPENDDDNADENDENEPSEIAETIKKRPEKIPSNDPTYYDFNFDSDGGGQIECLKIRKDRALSSLPVPYKEGKIFLGWYYDEEHTRAVATTDKATGDTTLYAKYQDSELPETAETPRYVSELSVDPSFTLKVNSRISMSESEVLSGITAKNLNDPDETGILKATGGGNEFILSARGDGFVPGASYKIILDDDNLTFDGALASAREYDFTTAKSEVLNVTLSNNLKFVKAEELSSITNDGQSVDTLSLPLYNAENGEVAPSDLTIGSFTYVGAELLEVGDSVAVYAGLDPRLRTLDSTDEENGDLAYIEITAKNGTIYQYKNADAKNVIFEPDLLPLPENSDLDSNTENDSVTVYDKYLDFSADIYSNVELDSQTTADTGDFLVFYRGAFGTDGASLIGYGLITNVTDNDNGTVTIEYDEVSEDDVKAAMDIYASESVDGALLLADEDITQLETDVELQAKESGFADEAGAYLASLALSTDRFTSLNGDTELFPEAQLMSEGSTNVSLERLDADISTNLEHFDGYSGVRLTLSVGVKITVTDSDENEMIIHVTGAFEQEVHLDIDVSSKTVWKVFGIFPYISDYKVTASVDLFDYTGISINASMITKSRDSDGNWIENTEFCDLAEQIKELLDSGEGDQNVSKLLTEKYKAMLKNDTEFVTLFEKTIFEQEFRVPPALPIIAVNIGVDFVVKADAVISLGFDFYYQNAKRYVYTVNVFAGKVYNDVIDIKEETYELTFYVLGRLNLRAGVHASFAIGLFSTKLASVGFNAEAGAYVKLYGYFYYELKYTASEGRHQRSIGALYIEVGIYLDLNFEAQAIGGKYSTVLTLYQNEWPLWSAGSRLSIVDFATSEKDMPDIKLKQYIRNAYIPDSIFNMSYLDLQEAKDGNGIYDDREHFTIEMTNPAFSYDAETNMITVSPSLTDKELTGQMIITWKDYPLAFTSHSIRRTINLSWDNLRSGYVIVPYTNGGSYLPIIQRPFNSKVTPPQNPEKLGYIFDGWYADSDLSVGYTFPDQMPDSDTEIFASWTPADNTKYRVEHYCQVLGSSTYILSSTEYYEGVTGSTAEAPLKSYEGFVAPAPCELIIKSDGSGVARYYYDLSEYTVTFMPGEPGGESEVFTLKHGAKITAPAFSAKGYTFAGWDSEVNETVETSDLTYTALWTKDSDTDYRVEYYVQQTDGRYILKELSRFTANTGDTIDVFPLRKDSDYCVDSGIAFKNATVNGTEAENATVAANGSTVIKINYERLSHRVTFKPENGNDDISADYMYEASVSAPLVQRAGYSFSGWEPSVSEAAGTSDALYTAVWTANDDTPYKVEHYLENADDTGYTIDSTDNLSGITDTEITAEPKEYEFFTLNTALCSDSGVIAGDGDLVLKLYYSRRSYTVYYENEGEAYAEQGSFKHGSLIVYPDAPTREGYNFGGWEKDGAAFDGRMTTSDITLDAKWIAEDEYAYTVKYFTEGLLGADNTLVTTKTLYGTFNSSVTVTPEYDYIGFTTPDAKGVTIVSGLTVEFLYLRNSYNITWNLSGGEATGDVKESFYFDEPIIPPVLSKEGHSYTWNTTMAQKMGAAPLSYTAIWTVNNYEITFDSAGGSSIAPIRMAYGSTVTPPSESPVKYGYTFDCWSDEIPTSMPAHNTNLVARWSVNQYTISYENLENATNSIGNKTSYTINDELITLESPQKIGYTFKGWYLDSEMTEENKVMEFTVDKANLTGKRFYAKWEANPYTITFDNSLMDGHSTDTQLMHYDTAQNLDSNTFTNNGYTFKGWSRTEGGTSADYTDGASVKNLAASGNVYLYAVWEAISYNITLCSATIGARGTGNPESYTIESEDISLSNPSGIKSGYQFLGWYDGSGARVTSITHGSTGNVTLTAKWAHGGEFSVSYVETDNGTSTFRITRSLPSGTQALADTQNVYYRTVNGTAIGGTAEAIHFMHVGGENVYATFTASDGNGSSKTFTVQGENPYAAYSYDGSASYVASGYTTGAVRYYNVELYKIVNTVNPDKIGTISQNGKTCKRSLTINGDHTLSSDWYDWITGEVFSGEYRILVTDDTNYEYPRLDAYPDYIMNWTKRAYISGTSGSVLWRLNMEVAEYNNGDQFIRFDTNTGLVDYWGFTIAGDGNCNWSNPLYIPYSGSLDSIERFSHGWAKNGYSGKMELEYDSSHKGIKLPLDVSKITVKFAADGGGEDDWYFRNMRQQLMAVDTSAPEQIGLAPMPFGSLKKDDEITIAVVFDEIVATAKNISASNLSVGGLSLKNPKYSGGAGSNVLLFTATVGNDFTPGASFNSTAISTKLNISGEIADICGNK